MWKLLKAKVILKLLPFYPEVMNETEVLKQLEILYTDTSGRDLEEVTEGVDHKFLAKFFLKKIAQIDNREYSRDTTCYPRAVMMITCLQAMEKYHDKPDILQKDLTYQIERHTEKIYSSSQMNMALLKAGFPVVASLRQIGGFGGPVAPDF